MDVEENSSSTLKIHLQKKTLKKFQFQPSQITQNNFSFSFTALTLSNLAYQAVL